MRDAAQGYFVFLTCDPQAAPKTLTLSLVAQKRPSTDIVAPRYGMEPADEPVECVFFQICISRSIPEHISILLAAKMYLCQEYTNISLLQDILV